MTGEVATEPTWDYDTWKADPSLGLRERYGDIYRLDAFPWVNDTDDRYDAVLEQRDAFDTPTGRARRYWRVTGGNGLGRPSERDLYLALLLLTAEAGWKSREISFTFRALAQRSGMRPGPKTYGRIADALSRLAELHVRFQGTTEVSREDAHGVMVTFFVVSSVSKATENSEVDCVLSWNSEVYRALRSAVQTRQASTPALSADQIMSDFLVPVDPEWTRPA